MMRNGIILILLCLIVLPVIGAEVCDPGGVITGYAPLTIYFTDTSNNTPSAWNWSFNDVAGNETWVLFSTAENSVHTFGAGNFSIRLNTTNAYGNNSLVSGFVNVSTVAGYVAVPVANFTANATSGSSPTAIQFNDTSGSDRIINGGFETGDTAAWGISGSTVHVISTTPHTGSYYVQFYTATSWINQTINLTGVPSIGYWYYGFDTAPRLYIDGVLIINPSHQTGWAYTSETISYTGDHLIELHAGSLHDTFVDDISAVSTENVATSRNWTFRDITGNNTELSFSTDKDPLQGFGLGNYSIRLTASNSAGSNTTTTPLFINISGVAPVCNFSVNKNTLILPQLLIVNDTSSGDPVPSRIWYWGDGTLNITTANATHQYTKRGVFNMSLTVTNDLGSSTKYAKIRVVGFQGITPADCFFTTSRELSVQEYRKTNYLLCGVCDA